MGRVHPTGRGGESGMPDDDLQRLQATQGTPWDTIRRQRTSLGVRVTEAAQGVISVSQWSHIEAGRMIPSRQVAFRIAERIGLDGEAFNAAYAPWRLRARGRNELWRLALAVNHRGVEQALERLQTVLTAFESHVWQAWLSAVAGDARGASLRIRQAWFGRRDAWVGTRMEWQRTEQIARDVEVRIARLQGRGAAVAWWEKRVHDDGAHMGVDSLSKCILIEESNLGGTFHVNDG